MRNLRILILSATAAMVVGLVAAPAGQAKSPVSAAELAAGASKYQTGLRSELGLTAGPIDCFGPAGDPAPGTPAWQERDAVNEFCATQRQADEVDNPAFGAVFTEQTPLMFADQNIAMFGEPGHPHVTLAQVIPGGSTADPFRTLDRWTAAQRGRVAPVSFAASDGAQLNGYLFQPPASMHEPPHGYPGIVITTGSIQGYQQLYFWAAEGLAEAGYVVLTYDVQGQGDSDTLPADCAPSQDQLQQQSICTGVPYQQNYNFFQGTEDALNFFFSTPKHPYPNAKYLAGASPLSPVGQTLEAYNPAFKELDASRVGIAGHSLGASAVSQVGQCDTRVKAIVAWDNLAPAAPCAVGQGLTLRTPALGFNSEYFFNPEPMSSAPDPHSKDQAFQQLTKTGVDTMQVALRSSMHLEYSYVPYILPASSLGERVAFYYTLAWFDYYLRNDPSGFARLTATKFDPSSDVHAIGAGAFSPAAAAADPSDPAAGNVPYDISDMPIVNRLSFYYESEYALSDTDGRRVTCSDMRAGCPSKAPATP
jgi:dienelactone hydrolase